MDKKKIVVISPSKNTRESLARVLSEKGYRVFTALSDSGGVEWISQEHPFLAVIERAMPFVDGVETLRRFKEISPKTSVMILASHESGEDAVKTIVMGAYDGLLKPPEVVHLISTIEQALDFPNRK